MTPTQRNKAAAVKIREALALNEEMRGHFANDLFHDDMDLEEFKSSMDELFWEDHKSREILNILSGGSSAWRD